MSTGVDVFGMRFQHAFHSPPAVADLPADWQTWSKNAIYFPLKEGHALKIYAVDPSNCSCYSLATFTFCDDLICSYGEATFTAYCTVIESKIYLLGRNDPNNLDLTELWIWDILEAQKKKLAGESYDWVLGPRPNSAKDMVLLFSLCGDLYALDICRSFYPLLADSKTMKAASKTRKKNPNDFERLPVSGSSSIHSWLTLSPLRLEQYGYLSFKGYCCLQDKFVLHMSDDNFLSYLFCFNVKTGMWTQRRFSDLPLTPNMPLDQMEELGLHCKQYSACVQNEALFVSPHTGKLSVFDFGALNDLMEKGSKSNFKYRGGPCLSVDVKDTRSLKNVLDSPPYSTFEQCRTFYLGDKRYCWIAYFYGFDYKLYAWVCTFDLEKETSVERYANISKTGSKNKKGTTEKTTLPAVNDVASLWMLSAMGYVLPARR